MMNKDIREMIEKDISRCESQGRKGSQALFYELKTKYTALDNSFMSNITIFAKAVVEDMDYRQELSQMKEKLKLYLQFNSIPIDTKSEETISYTINAKKFVNKGNLGNGNQQMTDKTSNVDVSINVAQKQSWFKRILKKGAKNDTKD